MSQESETSRPHVAIVGGGLAGLAAAVALSEQPLHVELFESRKQLGGRAGSFRDPASGELVDHCQHVGMGCCTNLADFYRRTGMDKWMRSDDLLHFFGPDGRRFDFRASRWLPAPLHLAPALLGLRYLKPRERMGVATAMFKLARAARKETTATPSIGDWLRQNGQSEQAIQRFWSVVLVSALGESIERASLSAARKVFVDGFMAHRDAYCIQVPTKPLGQLYDGHVATWLADRHVAMHMQSPIKQIQINNDGLALQLQDESVRHFDALVVAVPWRRATELFVREIWQNLLPLDAIAGIGASPITACHLWFDRAITELPHAVFIDKLSQWMFNRGPQPRVDDAATDSHGYQVVISASQELTGRDREDVLKEVLDDLNSVWPTVRSARLLRWRMVTEREAVFSYTSGLDNVRPLQRTDTKGLFLAGDWTQTGWPSTMEGAVRSGYLAAECVGELFGIPQRGLASELPRNWLVRCLLGGD